MRTTIYIIFLCSIQVNSLVGAASMREFGVELFWACAPLVQRIAERVSQPAPAPVAVQLDDMILNGVSSLAGGVSSLLGLMRLRAGYTLTGGAVLGALGGYLVYRVRAYSQQIANVDAQVRENGAGIARLQTSVEGIQDTLDVTRSEVLQGFAHTDLKFEELKIDLEDRIKKMHELLQRIAKEQNEESAEKHASLLYNLQNLQEKLTQCSAAQHEKYDRLSAQLTAFELSMHEQLQQNGYKLDTTIKSYIDERFNRIEHLLIARAPGAGASSSSSCHAIALTAVSE